MYSISKFCYNFRIKNFILNKSHFSTIIHHNDDLICNSIYEEDYVYNFKLNFLTKFNLININANKYFNKISLNFGFKNIRFEKKKMILFFMILELITNQKCVLTQSRKNLIHLKIKKGSIVGCKVTLRNQNLFEFLDNLNLSLPRGEMFKGFFYKLGTNKKNTVSAKLKDLFIFYNIESEIMPYINVLDIVFSLNTISDFEKFFIFSFFKLPLFLKK